MLKYNIMEEFESKFSGWHVIYTDGSKSCNGSGAAFYDPHLKNSRLFKINNNHVSIMTVELTAISEALTYIREKKINKVVVVTDSKSALQHLARCASGSRGVPKAYAILEQINYFTCNGIELILQWVPSHIGLLGNEEVDAMAKRAVTQGSEVYIGCHYSELLSKYKITCYNIWKEYFDKISKEKGIWYRTMQCEPPHIPWFGNINLNKKYIVIAHRLRTGHIPLNKFGFLMKKVPSPNCESCGILEDVHHLLVECVRYSREREDLMTDLSVNRISIGFFQSILSEPCSRKSIKIYKFVKCVLSR